MKVYKNFIFDVDGTLIDTFERSVRSLKKTVKKMKLEPLTKEQIEYHFRAPFEEFVDLLDVEDKQGFVKNWLAFYRKGKTKYYRGIPEILKLLKKRGAHLAVVSNRYHNVEGDWEFADIKEYFDTIVFADDVSEPKPAPDSILQVLQSQSWKHGETLYIGDTQSDRDCAKAAQVDFALALWGVRNHKLSSETRLACPLELEDHCAKNG
ncbi:MAG: HAD family hydrolase [Erysipelotrichaceae bacterium]|jgi:HAD superfamily hydrolase (TIGR01509 family)|nr:HAD family hydrolase [Erysipelotrichaceae bacterium]